MSMSMMLSACASPSLRLPLRNRPNNITTSSSFFKDPTTTTRRAAAAAAATPLKLVQKKKNPKKKMAGAVCSGVSFSSPQTLQWLSAVSSAVLMLVNGTAIQKSFLVPLFALQAPSGVISWIKGEYGIWIAFVALLVRLFYFIPGQLDLPFLTMLLVIVAPYQSMDLRQVAHSTINCLVYSISLLVFIIFSVTRGSQAGAIISFAIAGYLTFQHFSRAGSLRRAFDQGSIIATLAVVCIAAVSFFFLF
ncbi:cold-regulated 413 inner membrane protein 1, chloroplastic-like isoform X2 [Iris pallida]|uniref:Cold-regulated 413 inner membrane protein 1, chloroplastic-like isoform X2 n=1 Tax=Iris pallida TaxID=29817 RepID=A0AAX6DXG1_IRIPA|nr:cold-regulated 413 inner membrane protein 1, chloroplastic-like isoform X2 [Iris pallida]